HAKDEIRSRYDLAKVQGLLAVQQLDGWLLTDRAGQNSIAVELVNPDAPRDRWFYLIPAQGQPRALVHRRDLRKFQNVPGEKTTYTNSRNLVRQLRALLHGIKTVAMEYAPGSSIASLSRVDGGTVALIKARRVQIRSSAQL